ncbi:uncharacterized protein AAES06_020556 [Glossophaga mutica]
MCVPSPEHTLRTLSTNRRGEGEAPPPAPSIYIPRGTRPAPARLTLGPYVSVSAGGGEKRVRGRREKKTGGRTSGEEGRGGDRGGCCGPDLLPPQPARLRSPPPLRNAGPEWAGVVPSRPSIRNVRERSQGWLSPSPTRTVLRIPAGSTAPRVGRRSGACWELESPTAAAPADPNWSRVLAAPNRPGAEPRLPPPREGEKHRCDGEIMISCLLDAPRPGTEPTTYACALTRHQTRGLSLFGMRPNN